MAENAWVPVPRGMDLREPITVNIVKENAGHPVIKNLPDGWRTPEGELYNVQEIYPGTTVLAYGDNGKNKKPVRATSMHLGKSAREGKNFFHHDRSS
jgi:hypothetical protein